ncbi:hypothetical protein [Clostridium peptidivorans]|uniref:hypothetical protein n=1 Tax=Clostridium peptidivorans TaxID=100174 RepID=UPI0015C77D8C|nr:hypothetical protein [Clostridium peptidivorans]
MADIAKIRAILDSIRILAPAMNNEEISDVSKVLLKVTERLLKENNLKYEEEN